MSKNTRPMSSEGQDSSLLPPPPPMPSSPPKSRPMPVVCHPSTIPDSYERSFSSSKRPASSSPDLPPFTFSPLQRLEKNIALSVLVVDKLQHAYNGFGAPVGGAQYQAKKEMRAEIEQLQQVNDELQRIHLDLKFTSQPPPPFLPPHSKVDPQFQQLSNDDVQNLEEDDIPESEMILHSEISSLGPLVPPVGADLGIVKTYDEVFNKVFGAILNIHHARPDHEMFGEVDVQKVRCPLGPLKVPNEVSWHRKSHLFAVRVAKVMGDNMIPGSCWMVIDPSIIWQKKEVGRYAEVNAARLLCFLRDPTDEAWLYLIGEKYGIDYSKSRDSPFCHTCHNGESSKTTKSAPRCVNGLEHGFFGTSSVNNLMKPCAGPGCSRSSCPGHTAKNGEIFYCVYVNRSSGALQPCRNGTSQVLVKDCTHTPSCWV